MREREAFWKTLSMFISMFWSNFDLVNKLRTSRH